MPVNALAAPESGDPTNRLWRYVVNLIRRTNRKWRVILPQGFGSGYVDESENAITLDLTKAKFGGNVTQVPFHCANAPGNEIRVYYGSVNSPDGTFVPSGFTAGDVPPLNIALTGTTGVVWLMATIDNTTGEMTAISDPTTAASMPANTSTEFYLQIGSYDVTSGVLTVQSEEVGSLYFELCGGISPVWGAV